MTKKYCVQCGYDYYVSRFCAVSDKKYLCPYCRGRNKNAHADNRAGDVTTRLGKRK